MKRDSSKRANDPDAMAVCLAVVRGLVTIEQARQALRTRTAERPAGGLLGLSPALREEAAVPSRLPAEDLSACLTLLGRIQPERSAREVLKEEEALAPLLVEAGRISAEEVDEYLSVQRMLVASGQNPLPGLADLMKTARSAQAGGASRAPRIPGFEVKEFLGRGAMGAVYKARQTALDRWVAVKVMRSDLARDARFIERFQTEARTAGKLRHENIVSALDCGQAGGEYFVIMEYVEGIPLSKVLKDRGKLPEEEVLRIALEVARGLDYAWDHRIIHRDIKPGNILLTPDRRAKICDLGLCRDTGAASEAGGETFACTPSYASPEQVERAADLDCRTDLYSLGMLIYQMATGTLPFQGSPREILAQQLTETPARPRSRNPSMSPGLERLILEMIAKSRDQRPRTPKEVAQRIEALLAPVVRPPTSRGGSAGAARTSPTTRRKITERSVAPPAQRRWLAGAAAGILGAVALGLAIGNDRAPETPSAAPPAARAPSPVPPARPAPVPEAPAALTPSGLALKELEALASSSKSPNEILLACEAARPKIRGTPQETRFREIEERAFRDRQTKGKEEQVRNYLEQVRKMIDRDPSFHRSEEILRMLRAVGGGSPEFEALRSEYEGRFDRAAREARDEILREALPLREKKQYNDALALVRDYPAFFRSSKYGPELERLSSDIDREWTAQIAFEQGRSKWAGWRIPWGEGGELPAVRPTWAGKTLVLVTPASGGTSPFTLEREFSIPDEGTARIAMWVAAEAGDSWHLRATVMKKVIHEERVGNRDGDWQQIVVDLTPYRGASVRLCLEATGPGGKPKPCYWGEIDLRVSE